MRVYLFFSLFLLLFFSIHYLFYSRVIKKFLVSEQVKRTFTILLGLNFIFNILYVLGRYTDVISNTLYYLFSLSIGISFVLLLYLILHEILHLFHKTLKNVDHSKRAFFKKGGDGAMLALATSYVSAGAYEGSKEPAVNVVELNQFDFSIVQISDLHIGGLIDQEFVKNSVLKINALKPDIVFITGDLIDTALENIEDTVMELDAISSKYGIYYILGNHEYFHDPLKIIDFIKTTQIKLLLNEHVTIDALNLNVVGVTDRIGYRTNFLVPDIHKAFSGCNNAYKTILLAHQPKFIEELENYTPELILSGHTHGGQIWPFEYLVRLQQPYVKGLHKLPNGSHIYVNSGIGFWGPPMRLDSQAEIAYIV
ncbi:MAG: metallophosphoesterase [Sulfurovum sp.]|uniref:metallophosphoesterase n=1 Tax=Sulfurovum sp. TaxID=1969726 RepID=UPI0028680FFA|nr:metallophosphoesterase [Sulfurovum sp.]MCO4846237.1 metallophosphoesterase [Sulfurovum sp.]